METDISGGKSDGGQTTNQQRQSAAGPYTLAVLLFMFGLTAAQFAYQTGSGLIGAGLVGLFGAGVAFGVVAVLFRRCAP